MNEATNCFQFLLSQTPTWITQLQELERRVEDWRKEIESLPESRTVKKLRKSGSNESIRPGKENEETHDDVAVQSEDSPDLSSSAQAVSGGPGVQSSSVATTSTSVEAGPDGLGRQQPAAVSAPDLRHGKMRTPSIMSNVTAPSKYRSRSMITIKYDSVVQEAFDQLVRHISNARSRIRKARLAAKVGSFTEEDEDESDEDDDDDGDGEKGDGGDIEMTNGGPRIPLSPAFRNPRIQPSTKSSTTNTVHSLPAFRSTRALGMTASPKQAGEKISNGDTFTAADHYLETAQVQCEKGAHRFLRDGDCESYIEGAKTQFVQLAAFCDVEVKKLVAAGDERAKKREQSRRQTQTLRRGDGPVSGTVGEITTMPAASSMPSSPLASAGPPKAMPCMAALARVDGGLIEVDDGDEEDEDGDDEVEVHPRARIPMKGPYRMMAST